MEDLKQEADDLTAELEVPQDQREELREQLTRTLDLIQDPKTPPKERAAYMGIMDTVTETLKVIHDPKTGKKEQETYTKIVEKITDTLKVIHDPKTGKKVKETYTKIVEKITDTLEIIYDPKTGKKVKETYTKIVEKITDTLEIILPSKIPPKEMDKIEETVGDISHALVLIRAPKTPPKEQADIEKITEEISETLVRIYHPNTPPDKRAEAKKVEGSLIDELERQIKALQPNLVVKKKALKSPVSPGELQTFVIEITNRGGQEATGVELTDEFGSPETGVVWPVIDARYKKGSGEAKACDIPEEKGDTFVKCPAGPEGPINIAPGETVTITIQAGMKAVLPVTEPYGEKVNKAEVKFEHGKASGSAKFKVVEAPKLSNEDLQVMLDAVNKCGSHFGPRLVDSESLQLFLEALNRFVEVVKLWNDRQYPAAFAVSKGYEAIAVDFAPKFLMSLVKIPFLNVSLLDLARGVTTVADCEEFAKMALSVQDSD